VIDRISAESSIFDAWSDEPWVIDGAAVRVSVVCFGRHDGAKNLNGKPVSLINADLTATLSNLTLARRLVENRDVAFIGRQKDGPIDIRGELARDFLSGPLNPNGRPNTDVVHPWMNAAAVVRRNPDKWIIDFKEMEEAEASLYQEPFEYLRKVLKPIRATNRDRQRRELWWRPGRSGEDLRTAISKLTKYLISPRVSKFRVFVWAHHAIVPDSATAAIAKDDNTTFGILQSRFHEAWSLGLCTWLGVGNDPRYTPTTTFDTYPFPKGLTPNIATKDYENDPHAQAISKAAGRLDELRNAWLNPPDLVKIEPEVAPGYPDRILPKDAQAAVTLKTRTLTNLYNQRPQWLADAHRDLDAAVAAAYGWPADISEEDALAKLLELNLARAGTEQAPELIEEPDDED
jgi:type II restriction/modification system DNA methylase subunit YeeA